MDGMIDEAPEGLLVALTLAGIAVGILMSALEAALQRLTRAGVADLRHEGGPRADLVERILDQRDAALTAVTFVRIVSQMTAAVAITLTVADLLANWWQVLLGSVAATAIVMAAVLVGSSPHGRNPAWLLHTWAPLVRPLAVLASPIHAVRRTGRRTETENHEAADDLREMVDRVSDSDQIQDDEREMLHSVFELGRTLTREVMVPRPDMITVGLDTPLDKAIALFVRSGFSRVPVIGKEVDDMRGILFLKDALRAQRRDATAALTAGDVMRPVRYVPEMKLVDDLLREMQAESSHIAIVIDEYGGVAGLVTIEDLIEELVGELQDEHDADLPEVEDLGSGTFRVPARMAVDDLGELFDLAITDDDVDTAGGLLAKALGKVPIEGAEADALGLHLVAERSGGRRRQITTMLVSLVPDTEEFE